MPTKFEPPHQLPTRLLNDPAMTEACRDRDFSKVFRLVRAKAGIYPSLIARRCDLTPSRVGEILKGQREIRDITVIERVADGLRIPGHMLGLARRAWEAAGPPAAPVVGSSWAGSLDDALTVLGRLTQMDPGEEGPADLADADVNSAVFCWLASRPELPACSTATRRVGMRDVAAIRTAAEMFMRLDFLYGGGHGHAALRHYFRHEVLPLLKADYSAIVGRALFTAAAEMSQLLGWTAYDTGNDRLANRYLLSTLRLTQVTGDRMMGARILTNMSHQARTLGQLSRAVQLARASWESGKGHSTPRAMALFAAHEAHALSMVADRTGAAHAMNEAESQFARAEPVDDPSWLSYMDEAELIGEFSHCFRNLKEIPKAIEFAERAVSLTDPKYARTLGFVRMVLAQSQAMKGDLDAAVSTASQAVEEGDSLHSVRFWSYVTEFQEQISGHADTPLVSHFNEYVADVQARLEL